MQNNRKADLGMIRIISVGAVKEEYIHQAVLQEAGRIRQIRVTSGG